MGAFLDTPLTDKTTHEFEDAAKTMKCGVSCMQGWRIDMEDAHTVIMDVPEREGWAWLGVFDGHGGSLVANKSAETLFDTICAQSSYKAAKTEEAIVSSMTSGFLAHDENMRELPEVSNGIDHSGSTAITAMVTPESVIIGNCGDSRAVLARGDGGEVWGSKDHKPTNPGEKKRIEDAGGSVSMRRVNGDLAVSRALGDFLYKHRTDLPAQQQQVSAEPECTVLKRTNADDYLILCCDGIWDVMSNEEVVEFVRARVAEGETSMGKVCEMLLDHCLALNSRDNMSALIVQFKGASTPSPETVAKYKAAQAAKAEAAAKASDSADAKGGVKAAGGSA